MYSLRFRMPFPVCTLTSQILAPLNDTVDIIFDFNFDL